ncbi:hypothetical protein [Bacillus sp. Marseille-P3661]|uniref:hypothetical protein n=1 Tax=Bacillus sp. Marseille-P3661 TaxID=1936234 RepID=UPI000C8267E7|nr:hypothetical protein [Bacillus sp. Marseille-P3661]
MFNQKKLTVSMLVSLLLFSAGCSLVNQSTSENSGGETVKVVQPEENLQANDEQVISDFRNFMAQNPEISEVTQFMDDNVSKVSSQKVSAMILALEDLQINNLPKFEQKFTTDEDIQMKFWDFFEGIVDTRKIDNITDTELKTLLEEAKNSGYKIETAEGLYFPIIDYQFYKTYSSKATMEIQDYIEIMATESNQVPAKDGALMINWGDIVERALAQEAFLVHYQNSERVAEMTELYNTYKMFTFFGLNNTPLFDYDTKKVDPEAKAVFEDAVTKEKNNNSNYIDMLDGFLKVLSNNNDTLTDEVDVYRKDLTDFPG